MGTTKANTKPKFSIPGPLGNYVVLTKLNRGGMADVYLGQPLDQHEVGRWVALKTLLPNLSTHERYVEMFTSEGELGQLLKHPNIAQTWEVVQVERPTGPVFMLAMEYVHGRDLGAVARHFSHAPGRRMSIPQALFIVEGVLRGLSYAHALRDPSGTELHLVNRDISPPNIMIGFDGRVRLIDFGIAQATLDFRSQIGAIKGKLSYMSPEQVRGLPVDARSDLFSLTVVLYQLVTGIEPFAGDSEFEQMERVRRAEVQSPSQLNRQIPPDLEALLLKGLAREPNERYASARDMLKALEAIRDGLSGSYGALELASFMESAFQKDVNTLHSRIRKARQIMRQMVQTGARVWMHEVGEDGVAQILPKVEELLREPAELYGSFLDDRQPRQAKSKRPAPKPVAPAPVAIETPVPVAPPEVAEPLMPEPEKKAKAPSEKLPSWALPTLAVLGLLIAVLIVILGMRLIG